MFMVLSSWQSHCESSPGSFDERRTASSGPRLKTKPDDLGCESACTGCQNLHPPWCHGRVCDVHDVLPSFWLIDCDLIPYCVIVILTLSKHTICFSCSWCFTDNLDGDHLPLNIWEEHFLLLLWMAWWLVVLRSAVLLHVRNVLRRFQTPRVLTRFLLLTVTAAPKLFFWQEKLELRNGLESATERIRQVSLHHCQPPQQQLLLDIAFTMTWYVHLPTVPWSSVCGSWKLAGSRAFSRSLRVVVNWDWVYLIISAATLCGSLVAGLGASAGSAWVSVQKVETPVVDQKAMSGTKTKC